MSTDVHEGEEGWLFLTGVLGTLYDRGAPELPDARWTDWLKLIENRAARLEKMGIQYVHMPAPEKLTIYDNKLGEPLVDWRLSPALRLAEVVQGSPCAHVWVDVVQPLRGARDRQPLFPKTDSHWNAEGAFVAYKTLCDRVGIVPELNLLSRKSLDYHAVFDLGAKANPPRGRVVQAVRLHQEFHSAIRQCDRDISGDDHRSAGCIRRLPCRVHEHRAKRRQKKS